MKQNAQAQAQKYQHTLHVIENLIYRKGYPPSFLEIQHAAGLTSKSVVHYHVNALCDAGFLTYTPGLQRSISLGGERS